MAETFRYPRIMIGLHWLTAALIAAAWIGAQVIDFFPRGVRPSVLSLHMLAGLAVGAAMVLRLAIKTTGNGGTPPQAPGLAEQVSRFIHLALYVLMAAVVMLGIAYAWARGANVFGLFSFADAPVADKATRKLIGGLHELAANAILVVAGLHAVAALFHHYVLRDSVLRRMLPAA